MNIKLPVYTLYARLPELIAVQKDLVLATVTGAYGSTPQKPGSTALFGKEGLLAGTVGGGAVELSVTHKAARAVLDKSSEYCIYTLDNDISKENASICGGGMEILLDADPGRHIAVFQALKSSLEARTTGILVTIIRADQEGKAAIERFWMTGTHSNTMPNFPGSVLPAAIMEMLQENSTLNYKEINLTSSDDPGYSIAFLEKISPPPRLVIAGAGHVGKALSHLGKLLDFEVIVWDERNDYANPGNLPDADSLLSGDIAASLARLEADRNTYIVIVTQGHKNDSEVLKYFIGSSAGYIGMIGSKNKIAQVREKFLESKWATMEQWNRIYTPIGLEINSKTVQEIAISIAAQLVQVRYQLNHPNG